MSRHPSFTPALNVTSLTTTVNDLPRELDGFTIAHISDLHIGEGEWGPMRLAEAVAAIAAEKPDLIVNTGDFLQNEPPVEKVAATIQPLVAISSEIGSRHLAILGNHDVFRGRRARRHADRVAAGAENRSDRE